MVLDYRALVCARSVLLTRIAIARKSNAANRANERDERKKEENGQNAHERDREVFAKRQNQYQCANVELHNTTSYTIAQHLFTKTNYVVLRMLFLHNKVNAQ